MKKLINKILSKLSGEIIIYPKSKLQKDIEMKDPEPIIYQLKEINLGDNKIFYRVVKN